MKKMRMRVHQGACSVPSSKKGDLMHCVLLLPKVADDLMRYSSCWCLQIIMRLLVVIIIHPFVGLLPPSAYFGTKNFEVIFGT